MVLGSMLIAVALVMVLVALISYLHGKFGYVFWVLFAAGWLALMGAAVIDEQNALECVQEVEGFEGASSFHSYNSRMPEATEAIKDWMAIQWVSTPSTRAKMSR